MRIKVKEDAIKKVGELTDADVLFDSVQSIVLEYLGPDVGQSVDEKSSQDASSQKFQANESNTNIRLDSRS
jgi:hypothetical protein